MHTFLRETPFCAHSQTDYHICKSVVKKNNLVNPLPLVPRALYKVMVNVHAQGENKFVDPEYFLDPFLIFTRVSGFSDILIVILLYLRSFIIYCLCYLEVSF